MTFNIEKAKELMKIFTKLNEENQNVLLVKASELELEQSFKNNLRKSGKPDTKENLDEMKGSFLDAASSIMEHWDTLGPNHHAALAIMLNDMSKGELTKEEYIDFIVGSRQLSISEFIEKHIPDADVEEAKKIYLSFKDDMASINK